MKNVDLIEATVEELGGQQPLAGSEIVIRGIRYLIVEAKSPKAVSSRWKRKPVGNRPQTWKLLVERLDQSSN
jgi:hypothetical protein